MRHIPKRSTISHVNRNRKIDFFEDIFNKLYFEYGLVLSHSRILDVLKSWWKLLIAPQLAYLKMFWVALEKEAKEGKCKGGIKVHTVINANEKVPSLV